ncbi:iron chelate uptake ABC transporter family permease subunit, partial [Pseudomonas asplenii]
MSRGSKLSLALLLMLLSCLLSLAAGATWISPAQLLSGLMQADSLSAGEQLIVSTRLARTLMAIAVGSSLAVAGALMQALTRNPLASPGLFGVNAGATFSIILGSSLLALSSMQQWLWCA